MRSRVLVLILAVTMVTVTVPTSGQLGQAPVPGVSMGPENIVVAESGWQVDLVAEQLAFPSNIAFHGDDLVVVESGRDPYASPWDGQRLGQVRVLELSEEGDVTAEATLADDLADPIGLAIAPDGDVFYTQYGQVDRIPSHAVDERLEVAETFSHGYPAQTFDFIYAPVTGTHVGANVGEASGALSANTTGPMGLTVADDGEVYLTHAIHGTPPDPVLVRDVTGLDYDNPFSSSVINPQGGEVTPDEVAARACRNCYEPAVAPDNSPFEGELFATENVGAYRARLAPGEDRTVIEGSTPTDQAFVDGVVHADPDTGQIKRVATFPPTEPGTGGMAPTGIAFAPDATTGHGGEMFVTLMSGFSLMTNDRGYVSIVSPDLETGLGTEQRFVAGLDFPIDVTFGPDGAMYVLEFYDGQLWRLSPTT